MPRPKQNPNCLPTVIDPSKPIASENIDSREERFISLLFQGIPVREAGIAAGYSKDYSETGIYSKFKTETFQAKIRDYAISSNCRSIPKVCDLYSRTIDELHKEVVNGNLDNLAKLKHIPRQILEIGRILQPEGAAGPTLVNIESLQVLLNSKFNNSKVQDDEQNNDK
jgi:hypothetical protein